jgi:CRP-like cAMP-binding protein
MLGIMSVSFDMDQFFHEFASQCRNLQKKTFSKGENITTYIAKRNQFCILIKGEADLIRYDLNGNRTIVEHFTKNDIFGEVFYIITTNNELFVTARQNCEVLFLPYDNVKNKCKTNCKFHTILQEHLSELILDKVTILNTRVELLTKRSIRDKLLGYFTILSTRSFSRVITLPFSLTDLADYLSVDRSAMMREMKSLREEGFIQKNGNKITLLLQ